MAEMMDERFDAARLWRLEEVAEAAREIPLDEQPPRLRSALTRLVEIPREPFRSWSTPEDPRRPG
jgi:hypothetical protein